MRPLQTKIDRLKEEKDGVINDKDGEIEAGAPLRVSYKIC